MKKVYQWTIALILLGFIAAGVFLTVAPDEIVVHYNIRGEADRWGSKYEYLIMPFVNLIFGVFMAWLASFEGKKGRDMNERIVSIMNNWILILFNGMWIFFMWNAMKQGPGDLGKLAEKIILMVLAVSLVPMGNIMPKAQRNSLFGLRTKWSMANDHCWNQSQRIGGWIMVGAGVLGTILTAILPAAWGGIVLVVLLLAAVAGCTWTSYRIYMRSQIQ